MWSLFKKKYPVILPSGKHGMSNAFIDREVLDILTRLRKSGYDSYLVGGCIRDILLGKKVKDFDIVTDAHPRQIKRLFKRCFLIGKRFRLAHVYVSNDRFIEVATFRALVDPEDIKPDDKRYAENNVFGNIEEDAQRRDFTINALYYNSADSSIEDYTGGLEDIKKKHLRSIGDPVKRFRDDPVRIIRAGRFCAQLGFTLPRREMNAALKCASCIADANSNRLLEELYKILKCGAAEKAFTNLNAYGILSHWIPELGGKNFRESLLKRLEVVDGRRMRGQEITTAVLVTTLFFDLFEDAVGDLGERAGHQDVFGAIRKQFNDMAIRMRLPRKEWDKIANIASRLWTFKRYSAKRRMRGEARFVHNPYFEEALRFFEIYAETAGGLETELKFWWQRESEIAKPAPQVRSNAPTPHLAVHGGARRQRPPRHQNQPKDQDREQEQPREQEQTQAAGENAEKPKKRRRRRPRRRKSPGQSQAPQSIQA